VIDDVIAFEASVDGVFDATDKVWAEYNVGGPANVNSSFRSLYGRLLGAVQESYAYPVLGDVMEKRMLLPTLQNLIPLLQSMSRNILTPHMMISKQ
jgi:hypothetical protein